MTACSPATPAERLARILDGLYCVVAAEGLARGLAGPFIILVCARLRFFAARFAAHLASRPRPRRVAPSTPRPRARKTLPRRYAWLLNLLPGAAAARAQLRALLAEPDMRAAIESRPATGRALRPLCHTLGIPLPPALHRPRRPRPRPPAAEPAPPKNENGGANPAPPSPGFFARPASPRGGADQDISRPPPPRPPPRSRWLPSRSPRRG
ncbi:hypothetical protein [Acidiphilium sp.]|uniref:hypothetical protein n=1 Tax=Acidiphilium sp. TaxID=527 RepID=UPI00258FAF21|nr:hypothetical protein [Acidiphilium sp.]